MPPLPDPPAQESELLPQEVPPPAGELERNEEDAYKMDGKLLDLRLRRFAGYGALLLAFAMYAAGLLAVALFVGAFQCHERYDADMWHIVTAVLIALFSVPTFLLIAVLRSTSVSKKDLETENFHAMIGSKIVDWIGKSVSK
jgi:hypothetical protein